MNTKTPYRIVKCESNRFIVDIDGKCEVCSARKKIKNATQNSAASDIKLSGGVRKKLSGIVAGDFCYVEKTDDGFVLESIAERKNFLLRPNVANIDAIIIVAAFVPEIDYFLIDKLIINAHRQKLSPVLCLNKSDINSAVLENLTRQYGKAVDEAICISAKNDEITPLKNILKGKLSCLAGQSAVGKSTIVNALLRVNRQQTGDLSQGNMRGKNTTTVSEIIVIDKNSYIIDTPGFSMLDIYDIEHTDLALYYDEYVSAAHNCRFNMCTHTAEPGCAVKELIKEDKLDLQRYERYVIMFNELKNKKRY